MPHVVVDGPVDLREFARGFEPILIRRGRDVLRTEKLYLEREARALLIEVLVLESGRKQRFYVVISAHDRGSATVRIDPMTHPERSEGVRELVGRVGAELLARTPGARLGPANVVIPSGSRDDPAGNAREEGGQS